MIYEPILAVARFSRNQPAIARGCGYLATLYAALGEREKAAQLFDEAQDIVEKSGARGQAVAWVYNNRGLVELNNRRYAEALRSFRKALATLDPDRPEDREPRAIALENLASAYCILGDAEHAEEAYLEALDVLRRLNREGKPAHQVIRGNLATLYGTMGDYAEARRILETLAREPGLGKQLRFKVLNDLGFALAMLREFTAAEEQLLQAQEASAEHSRQRALVLTNLASMYRLAGNHERAEETSTRVLRLFERLHGEDSRLAAAAKASLAVSALNRGELLKADRLLVEARKVLSVRSGNEEAYAEATRALALVAQKRGQNARALALSREALDFAIQHLERILAFGSEVQRLAYRSHASPYDQLANLGDPSLLADAVLAAKGAVLDSLLAERALARRNATQQDQEQLDRIHALKLEIMQKIGRGESDLEVLQRKLKTEETALAKRLAPHIRRPRGHRRLADVRASLADDQVLIDLIRYHKYQDGGKLVWSYGGVVIAKHREPRWVPLGEAAQVEAAIARIVGPFGNGTRGVSVSGSEPAGLVTTLRELHDALWKPLAEAIPAGTRKVLLNPDAATSFLPWATLLDENERLLAETWQLVQIGPRSAPEHRAPRTGAGTFLALADGGQDLPFSRDEVEHVAQTAQQHGWKATTLAGAEATEGELFRRSAPRILHLATHAGVLSGDAGSVQHRLRTNPMYRGYLMLGGGKDTLDAWRRGAARPFAADGILTAEEAGALDLSTTWLTVLSACQTGAGDIRAGEGILGLRRGFGLAGTEYLLFSLWPVRDDTTAEFMKDFYDRLFATGDPEAAFHETQIAELRRWVESIGISAAVYRAGGFVLTR